MAPSTLVSVTEGHGGRIDGLAGVIVWTSRERFEAMDRFYCETLRLVPRSRRRGFVNFDWGDVRLTIAAHDELDGPATDPLRIMVNLATEDIDAVHAQLVSAGVPVRRPPERESWGGRVATYADPDGNTVQLLAPPGS